MKNVQPAHQHRRVNTAGDSFSPPRQNFSAAQRLRVTQNPPEDGVKADGIRICFYIPRIKTFIIINYVRWLWEIKSCTQETVSVISLVGNS